MLLARKKTKNKKQKTKTKQTDNFNEIPTIHAVF